MLSFAALVRGIAEAGAVTPEEFGRQAGLAAAEARKLFERFAASGMEVDASGNIVGAALTTQRTAHSLSFGGRKFFAWCALDTLFIPGLLGEVADIESVCPVSNAAIRLVVTPEGVDTIDPADTVLSVVLPAAGCPERATGPASPT